MILLIFLIGFVYTELSKAEVKKYFGSHNDIKDCTIKVIPYDSILEGNENNSNGLVEKCCLEKNITNCEACRIFEGECLEKIIYTK